MSEELQRKKLKEKEKSDVGVIPGSLEDLRAPTVVTPKVEREKEDIKKEKISAALREKLPSWVKDSKKYDWVLPQNPEIKEKWIEQWSDMLLIWADTTGNLLVPVRELKEAFPFTNPINEMKIQEEALEEIFEFLIGKKKLKYWNEEKDRVRIYPKTLTETANRFYKWCMDSGMIMHTLMDIKNLDNEFSNLPSADIIEMFKKLVEQNRAFWGDDMHDSIEINIHSKGELPVKKKGGICMFFVSVLLFLGFLA